MTDNGGSTAEAGEASGDIIVDMSGVTVSYGDAPVLSPTNLRIRRGEFVTLYGPSGCGKSTMLNVAAGLLAPASGSVLFDGEQLSGVNTQIGYMTQEDTLLPWQTLSKNVTLPLRIRKTDKAVIRERLDRYLQMLDLGHAANRFPMQLSGGMKKRALMARSMIYEPRMLLMDEPFAAVDATLREDLHAELRRTIEETQQTVMFVTHDVYEAALLSDRVLVFGGRPSTIIAEFQVPFGSGRDLSAIRESPEFAQLQKDIRSALDRGKGEDTNERS